MRSRFVSQGAAKTKQLGAIFTKKFLRADYGKRALVIALKGDLGAGKTTFTQGMAKAIGVKRRIASPTFLLARTYPLKHSRVLYHVDCYRITKPSELLALGWRDWISHPNHIIVIEWAEKIHRILPRNTIYTIQFKHGRKKNERIISISA